MVAHDQVYKGMTLKHGDMILIPTAMHGLDKAHNTEPLTVALDRRGIAHSTFGGGPHRCAGMHLAGMEVIVTLEEWLKRNPEILIKEGEAPISHSGTVAAVDNVPLVWTVNPWACLKRPQSPAELGNDESMLVRSLPGRRVG